MTPGTGQESSDLHSTFDLIERGRRAQAAADAILAAKPERRRTKRPKGRA